MTKKHYEAIANIMKGYIPNAKSKSFKYIAEDLADYFAQDNPKFDRERFLNACGIKNTSGDKCPECGSLIDDYYQTCTSPKCDYFA